MIRRLTLGLSVALIVVGVSLVSVKAGMIVAGVLLLLFVRMDT